MYKDKKTAVLKQALKGKATPVNVVNKVEIAEKPYVPPKPTIRLTTDDLPDIKGWSVGKKYTIQLEVEQTSMSQGSEYEFEELGGSEGKGKIRASFKIMSAKAV